MENGFSLQEFGHTENKNKFMCFIMLYLEFCHLKTRLRAQWMLIYETSYLKTVLLPPAFLSPPATQQSWGLALCTVTEHRKNTGSCFAVPRRLCGPQEGTQLSERTASCHKGPALLSGFREKPQSKQPTNLLPDCSPATNPCKGAPGI